jgi:hypothetical protein
MGNQQFYIRKVFIKEDRKSAEITFEYNGETKVIRVNDTYAGHGVNVVIKDVGNQNNVPSRVDVDTHLMTIVVGDNIGVVTDLPTGNIAAECFPSSAMVMRYSSSSDTLSRCCIDQVCAGDMVLSGPNKQLSEVIGLSHADAESVVSMLQLELDSGDMVTMTQGHYIPRRMMTETGFEAVLCTASSIQIGDELYLALTEGAHAKVTAVHRTLEKGLWCPVTRDGQIVVNGVVASCFTTHFDMRAARLLLRPVAMLPTCLRQPMIGAASEVYQRVMQYC